MSIQHGPGISNSRAGAGVGDVWCEHEVIGGYGNDRTFSKTRQRQHKMVKNMLTCANNSKLVAATNFLLLLSPTTRCTCNVPNGVMRTNIK